MENLEPEQFDRILALGGNVLIMFYADWCPFCSRFKPFFESIADSKESLKCKMYGSKVNDDDNPLWDRFSINAVPTVIAFNDGKILSRRDAKMGLGLNESDLHSILKESECAS
jgi:thioredoxin-like negative regulator of GroEL